MRGKEGISNIIKEAMGKRTTPEQTQKPVETHKEERPFIIQDIEAYKKLPWIPDILKKEPDHESQRFLLTEFLRALNKAHIRMVEKDKARGKKLNPQEFLDQQMTTADYVGDTATELAQQKLEAIDQAQALAVAKLAVEKAEKEATTHHLTGLLRVKGMAPLFEREMKLNEREGEKRGRIVVVRFDLDDFKAVNKYGHLAGDNVLQQVGKILQEHSRPGDYPLHNSGDEFGFVLVDVKPGEAETLEETVTKIIARYVDEIEKGVIRPDGKTQRISPGFRIVGKDEHGGFETFDGQADLAGEKSKEFKYDMDDKGNRITTAGSTRIINFETMHTVESKLSHGTRRSLAIEESIQREFQATIDALEKKVADGSITKEELEKLIATKELFLHVVRKAVDSKPPEKTSPVMEDEDHEQQVA